MSEKPNRAAREMLEKIYGKKCMIHDGIRKLREVKKSKRKYKGKSIAYQLTYHHLKPKRNGGKATLENGAVLCRSCHDWLESLSARDRERINDELREYKRQIDYQIGIAEIKGDKIVQAKVIEPEIEEVIEIPVYDNNFTEEQYLQHKRERKERVYKKFERERYYE